MGKISSCAWSSWHQSTYEGVLVPGDTGLLVGVGVGVAVGLASLAAEETVEVGADLVGATALNGVALSAAGLIALLAFIRHHRIPGVFQLHSPGRAWHPWQSHLE